MEGDILGPFCQEIQLSRDKLTDLSKIKTIENCCIKTGVLFELYAHLKTVAKVIDVAKYIQPSLSLSCDATLRTKLTRLLEVKKKLVAKKKVKGVSSIAELQQQRFEIITRKIQVTPCKPSGLGPINSDSLIPIITSPRQETEIQHPDIDNNISPVKQHENSTVCDNEESPKSQKKILNVYEYELNKKKKMLNKLLNEIELTKAELKLQESKVGHYAVRNVNKRDEKARATRQTLRESEANVRSLTKLVEQLKTVKTENELLKEELRLQNDKVSKAEKAEHLKVNAQKSASYYKMKVNQLKQKLRTQENPNNELKGYVREKEIEIQNLRMQTELLTEELNDKHCTKNKDGSYTDNVRLCIMELAALEVATEKISPVIEVVSKHIFSRELTKGHLPNSTSVQAILNEGHYLAKAYIATRIDAAESWGLNRDGTTRKKKKIVDTSVTLDSGDIISLGFTRVAHESAKTIHDVTVKHMEQLAHLQSETGLLKEKTKLSESQHVKTNPIPKQIPTDSDSSLPNVSQTIQQVPPPPMTPTQTSYQHESPTPSHTTGYDFISESLNKLAFTMSDRAGNEKLADKLLDEWREEIIDKCNDAQKQKVHHFHCMAHVLLGFHKYACSDLKSLENKIIDQNGPLGRDALPQFKFWTKKGTSVERVTRTVSETFGPAGDHFGLRDRWEAYCSQMGIKTIIGNYRDNRFNSLFQTAAEVLLHAEDILKVIDTVKQPNQKIKSVQADLKCSTLNTMLQCFGLFYVKVTGPYWNLVTGGEVPYLLLYSHVQELADFLRSCATSPKTLLLNPDSHWSNDDRANVSEIPYRSRLCNRLFAVDKCNEALLFETVQVVANAMLKCVEKQLADFMPEGQYAKEPSEKDLKQTSFAHSTNLGCEHHFGDLDSSQKRRPNASMHHHTTVQLLKRNRKSLINWLSDMPPQSRSNLMKKARKGGKELKEISVNVEKAVMKEINEDMIRERDNPQKRRKTKPKNDQVPDEEEDYGTHDECISNKLPIIDKFTDNEYVAVAYQDNWYPGCVIKSQGQEAIVKFLAPCRKPGHYIWPVRDDIQTVNKEFVLMRGFFPQCVSSGRQWYFKEHNEIANLFDQYKCKFFNS